MIRKTPVKVFALAAVLSAVGVVAAVARVAADGRRPDPLLAQLAGYREWSHVALQPVPLDAAWVGG